MRRRRRRKKRVIERDGSIWLGDIGEDLEFEELSEGFVVKRCSHGDKVRKRDS